MQECNEVMPPACTSSTGRRKNLLLCIKWASVVIAVIPLFTDDHNTVLIRHRVRNFRCIAVAEGYVLWIVRWINRNVIVYQFLSSVVTHQPESDLDDVSADRLDHHVTRLAL